MLSVIWFFISGFVLWEITTHPKRKFRKKYFPSLKFGRLEILPCLRIHGQSRTLHIHHWVYLPLILIISIPLDSHFLDSMFLRSFLLGGTVQGFAINHKARKLIYPNPLESSDEYR